MISDIALLEPRADVDGVLDAMRAQGPVSDEAAALVLTAHALATAAHAGQTRRSGSPYITHPVAVATLAAELGMDATVVAAALCHDVVEDTDITLEEIAAALGVEAAQLVDALTKIDKVRMPEPDASSAATMSKMLIAVTSDPRALVLKLLDRLHNSKDLTSPHMCGPGVPAERLEKNRAKAIETLHVYAPLAHRMGLGAVKWQLEDLAFAALHPDRYREIAAMVEARAPERDAYIAVVVPLIEKLMADAGIPAKVHGRPKHLWSVYEKMIVRKKPFDDIHDLLGVRIIVDDEAGVSGCYGAVGALHAGLQPVPGALKDYIASPRFNMYQSIHALVISPTVRTEHGKLGPVPIEVQIRTAEMHERAEHGIASHFGYKQQRRGKAGQAQPSWLGRLLDWHMEAGDPAEFMRMLKQDLGTDEVLVLTPKGKAITLPVGACGLDFAYAVHTDVGNRCIGVKVNGQIASPERALRNGDIVEVITGKESDVAPRPEWLTMCRTAKARAAIRHTLKRERREDEIESGRERVVSALRALGTHLPLDQVDTALAPVADIFGQTPVEELLRAVATGGQSATAVAIRLRALLAAGHADSQAAPARLVAAAPDAASDSVFGPRLHVDGFDDAPVTLAICCQPQPGADVVGVLRSGRRIEVHRAGCPRLARDAHADRFVQVEWSGVQGGVEAALELEAFDRTRLLVDVALLVNEAGANITACHTKTGADQVARQRFEFVASDAAHVQRIAEAVAAVAGVFTVRTTLARSGE